MICSIYKPHIFSVQFFSGLILTVTHMYCFCFTKIKGIVNFAFDHLIAFYNIKYIVSILYHHFC